MKTLFFFCLIFCLIFSRLCFGYETDQFTTPKEPLADIGDDFTLFLMKEIHSTINEVNHKEDLRDNIKKMEKELITLEQKENEREDSTYSHLVKERKIKELKTRFDLMQTILGIVKLISIKIGGTFTWQEQLDGVFGLPFSIFPYKNNLKNNMPINYRSSKFNTIYSYSGFNRLISPTYFVFCSTLRAFDIYFGADKPGHMFNQGFQYYEIYQQSINEKQTKETALKKIMDYGSEIENKWFGMLVDGVYSNADLAANMAGFHFYKNLFEEIQLNDILYAPLLILQDDGTIVLNPEYNNKEKAFVAKFFTLHLNEAFNPSHIEKLQREIVTKAIKNRCEKFMKFYQVEDREVLKQTIDSMNLWNNIPYGHNNENLLRVDEICY